MERSPQLPEESVPTQSSEEQGRPLLRAYAERAWQDLASPKESSDGSAGDIWTRIHELGSEQLTPVLARIEGFMKADREKAERALHGGRLRRRGKAVLTALQLLWGGSLRRGR